MKLTYSDFKVENKLYRGKLADRFYFNGTEIFKFETGEFYQRCDTHSLPLVGFFPDIEIYKVEGKLVLVFLSNHHYTFIEKIKIIESKTKEPFTGFEPNKTYELENGQIWRQVNGPYAPNHLSSGYVKIFNDEIMMVDNWSFFPRVILINN